HRKQGLADVKAVIVAAVPNGSAPRPRPFPELYYAECHQLAATLAELGRPDTPSYLIERALLDVGGYLEAEWLDGAAASWQEALRDSRARLKEAGCRIPAIEAKSRYAWAKQVLTDVVTVPAARPQTLDDRVDRVLTHRFAGL